MVIGGSMAVMADGIMAAAVVLGRGAAIALATTSSLLPGPEFWRWAALLTRHGCSDGPYRWPPG